MAKRNSEDNKAYIKAKTVKEEQIGNVTATTADGYIPPEPTKLTALVKVAVGGQRGRLSSIFPHKGIPTYESHGMRHDGSVDVRETAGWIRRTSFKNG